MPKGGIFKVKRRKEARKEEDLSLQTPAPENRTNLCSYAKRIIKIGSKLKKWEPKSTSQLENSHPLFKKFSGDEFKS